MAEKLDSPFPDDPRARYPWHEWFDGSVWRLEAGRDFKTSLVSMRTGTYMAAQRHGGSVRVHLDPIEGVLIIQFTAT